MDAQLVLYVFGKEESGTGVSAQAVGHNEDQRTPTGSYKTPAGDTHAVLYCLLPSQISVLFNKSYCLILPENVVQTSWLSVELVWKILQGHERTRQCVQSNFKSVTILIVHASKVSFIITGLKGQTNF